MLRKYHKLIQKFERAKEERQDGIDTTLVYATPGEYPKAVDKRLLRKSEHIFHEAHPTYQNSVSIDHLRRKEYHNLDKDGHIYLDYTGGGLYAEFQLQEHFELLRHNIFGNPHSISPTSSAITKLDEQARASVLQFFNASPEEYTVIFTANSSHALKLLGEAYPFAPDGELALLWDNHNSVHGIREFAKAKGASVKYVPVSSPDLLADEALLWAALEPEKARATDDKAPARLFAYPAQSNFSGVQHPLEWIATAQARGWHVLLDAASFVPTNRLDLSKWHPDFVPVSFYKMFGYPTGVGCLIARKASLSQLKRPWFAGGTVWGVTVQTQRNVLSEGNEAFEDGTVNYLSLPAVEIGLKHLANVGMEMIHERVICLTDWLLKSLLSLYHHNGKPLIRIYGPQTTQQRGGTISFNFIDVKGLIVDERIVDQRAAQYQLSLRTGCFCNPGAGEAAFNLSERSLLLAFDRNTEHMQQHGVMKKWDDFLVDMGMPNGGAIRVSLGLVTNFADVYRFIHFTYSFLNRVPTEGDLVPRPHC